MIQKIKIIHIVSSIKHTFAQISKFYSASRYKIIRKTSYDWRKEKKKF